MDDFITGEFTAGVNAYWGGEVPDGDWESAHARSKSPYLTGWYMASMWEVSVGFITDEFGEPAQDEDDF